VRYRHLRRTIIAVMATLALVLFFGALTVEYLDTPGTRRKAARWLSRKLTEATGADVEVQELQWGILPPRLDLKKVTLHSAPLDLSAEEIAISGAGLSLARHTLALGSLSARGVRVRTRFDRMVRTKGRRPWLNVIIRQLDLQDVDIEGSGLPGHLDLLAKGLRTGWTIEEGSPRGHLHVRSMTLKLPKTSPLDVALTARFSFNFNGGLDLPSLELRGSGIFLAGSASWKKGVWAVDGRGHLDLQALDDFLHLKDFLQGELAYAIRVRSDESPWLDVDLQAPRLGLLGFEATGVDGRIVLLKDRLTGTLRRASLFGGSISGRYELGRLGAPFPHSAVLHGRGVDLAPLLRWLKVPETGVMASGAIDADLAWDGRRIKAGTGHATVDLTPAPGGIPAEGRLKLALVGDGLIRFNSDGLRVGESRISWQGPLTMGSWQPAWSITADPARLSEISAITNALVGTTALPPGINGQGSLQLSLAGSWTELQVALRLEAGPLIYPPLKLDRALISASIADGTVRIREGSYLLGSGGGRVEGRLSWRGVPEEEQIDVELTGARIPLPKLAGQLGYDQAEGLLSFAGGLHGPIAHPRGSWAIGLVRVRAGPASMGDGSAMLTLEDGTFSLMGLRLGGDLGGEIRWRVHDRIIGGDLRWKALSTDSLGTTAVRMLGPAVGGRLRFEWPLDASFEGELSLESSLARIDAHIEERSVRGQLDLKGIGAATLDLREAATMDLRGTATVEVSSLAELNRRLLAARGEAFDGSAHATLHIVIPRQGEPTIEGVVDRVNLVMGDTTGGLVRPARFRVAGRSFSTPGLWIKTVRGDELFLRLKIDAKGSLSGNVSGTANARLFRLVAPDWETYGEVQLVGEISGSLQDPRFDGIAEIEDGSFRLPGSRIVFSSLTGTAILSPQGIELDGSTFRVLGGKGRVAGWIRIGERGPELGLSGSISRARMEILPGLSPRFHGDWWLQGSGEDLTLGGDLKIDRTALRRKDELSAILLDWFTASRSTVTATIPRLDIRVEGDRAIDARNAFLRFQTSAFLHVTGTPAEPGLVGKIELSEGGEFTFQGVRYEIDSGLITFSDPTRIVPALDLRLRSRVDVYEIWVNLSGSGDRIIPTLSSDPPLSQEEIVALLATGHRSSESSGSSSGTLASSILSSSLGEVLDQRARSLLAVDQVRIDPFSESDAGSPTARITLVKQLTPTWTIAVESNLASNREEVFLSRWILAPQVYLEVTRQRDGSWAADLRLRKRY